MNQPSKSLSRLAVLCLAVGVMWSVVTPADAAVKVGDKPVYQITTLSGEAASSAQLKGRILVLDFWATWCGPCIQSIPELKKIHETYADKNVSLISISIDDNKRTVENFLANREMNWIQVHDAGKTLQRQFGVTSIPRVFIISPEGEVVWTGSPNALETQLKETIEKFPPPVKEVDPTVAKLDEARQAIVNEKDYGPALKLLDELDASDFKSSESREYAQKLIDEFSNMRRSLTQAEKDLLKNNPDLLQKVSRFQQEVKKAELESRRSKMSTRPKKMTPQQIEVLKRRLQQVESQGNTKEAERLRKLLEEQEAEESPQNEKPSKDNK